LLHAKGYSLRGIADRVKHRLGLMVSHMTVKAVLRREEAKQETKGRVKPCSSPSPASSETRHAPGRIYHGRG
jgi:hypothetical protein